MLNDPKKILLLTVTMACIACCAGCPMIAVVLSPSAYERKVPAEFDMKEHQQGGIFVFVDQTRGSYVGFSLQPELREMMQWYLVKKARVSGKYIITDADFSAAASETPRQTAARAGAALVLYVRIEDYTLYQLGKAGYYSGSLMTRSLLIDVDSGSILWPDEAQGRVVRAKVEMETTGRAAIRWRLIAATAHGVARHFFDCPRPLFRAMDVADDYNNINDLFGETPIPGEL